MDLKKTLKIALLCVLVVLNGLLIAWLAAARLPAASEPEQPVVIPVSAAKDLPQAHIFLPLLSKPGSEGIAILANSSIYSEIDGANVLHIVGEVLNNTPTPVRDVIINAALVLPNGEQQSFQGSVFLNPLKTGEKTCFNLYLVNPPRYNSYELSILSYATGGEPVQYIDTLITNQGEQANLSRHLVAGVVNNPRGMIYPDLAVVATIYDAAGSVLACDQTFVTQNTENPTAPGSFSLLFMERPLPEAATYSLQLSSSSR